MSPSATAPCEDADIDATAAQWVVRMDADDVGDDERAAFDRWMTDARHRAAYAMARRLWTDMASLDQTIVRLPARRRSSVQTGVSVGAMAACLMLTVKAASIWYGSPIEWITADHRTAIGEVRRVALSDGSWVTLNTGSAIVLAFTDQERRIELMRGEIYVEAAPMGATERRPLIVETDAGTAKALGTRFSVDRHDAISDVTVMEHTVAVSPAHGDAAVLSPGQRVRISHHSIGPIQSVNGDQATSWQRGRLIFDRAPLADVLAELNRYRRGKILLSRDDLADRQVSGVFDLDNLDGALGSITRELGLKTAQMPLLTVIY